MTEWQIYFRIDAEMFDLRHEQPDISPEDLADAIEAGGDRDREEIDFGALDEDALARVLEHEARDDEADG